MDPIADSSVVSIDPEVHHGDACFRGTRVPVALLFACLAGGDSVETFVETYPSVRREQVEVLLEALRTHSEGLARRPGPPARVSA